MPQEIKVSDFRWWNRLSFRAADDFFLLISVEKHAFVCVQLRVRNWLFLNNWRKITLKIIVRYNYKKERRPRMWRLQEKEVGWRWGRGSTWPHARKIPRLIKKKKNGLKEQYVGYLFNNTSVILRFTEEQYSIFMQQGEEIGLFVSSVMWAVWAEDEYFTHYKIHNESVLFL